MLFRDQTKLVRVLQAFKKKVFEHWRNQESERGSYKSWKESFLLGVFNPLFCNGKNRFALREPW